MWPSLYSSFIYGTIFLGVTIDVKLNFQNQFDEVQGRLSRWAGALWKMWRTVPQQTMGLFISCGLAYFYLWIVICGIDSKMSSNKLQKVLNRMIRIIYGSSCDHQHWEKYRFVILDPTENYFHIDNKRILFITIKQVNTSERSERIPC